MAALRLRGVQPRLLRALDLDVAAGELVFISGPSGSGKSLLLRAIADLDPHAGEAFLGDAARADLSAPRWRRRVGFLPAESGWWAETVGEHFAHLAPAAAARPDAAATELRAMLERLGFELDVFGWDISRLSTGERQRLALARLLHNRPEALLLDEATANLDPTNRERVETVVEAYRTGHAAAVLWVSHDPDQRRRIGGRSLVIQAGVLVPEPGLDPSPGRSPDQRPVAPMSAVADGPACT